MRPTSLRPRGPWLAVSGALALALGLPAAGEIAVTANDGKQLRPGETVRTADGIAVLELARSRPKVIGRVAMPACMIGPPEAVAVAANGRSALVTCSERLDGDKLAPATTVSLVDLSNPARPRLVQSAEAGPGASGVSINRAGTLALVASTGDDTVRLFAVGRTSLTPAGMIRLDFKARPTDAVFSPADGRAMIVAQGQGRLLPIAVTATSVTLAGAPLPVGMQPYGASFSPDGRFIYNTNLGGDPARAVIPGERRAGTVTATEVASGRTASVEVGITPEHVTLSRDGHFAAVVVANGTGAQPGAPGAYGLLQIYSVDGIVLTKVAEARTGAWGQGALFSADGRTVLLQIAASKQIEVYRFDGRSLTRDPAATLSFDARPGSIAAARSR